MKKRFRQLLVLGALLAVFLGLAPRFLHLTALRDGIVDRLGLELNCEVSCAEIRWTWLPFPHLSLADASLKNPRATLILPEVRLFPHWRILLGDTTRIGRIHLVDPKIILHAPVGPGPAGVDPLLPRVKITIENGEVIYDPLQPSACPLPRGALRLSQVKGTIATGPDLVRISLRAAAPFCKQMTIKGTFAPVSQDYGFELEADEFMVPEFSLGRDGNTVVKTAAPVDLQLRLEGSGLERFTASITGAGPSLAVRTGNKSIILHAGKMDLRVDKAGPDFSVTIRDLEIKEPALRLQGLVARSFSPAPTENGATAPDWRIDLSAHDLDLTGIRTKIMTLWPRNKIAATVCNVVRGGTAAQARFRFNGPATGLADLAALKIQVDVADAAIHVPGAGLDLRRAKGPITIVNGILAGQDLRTRLGNSYGWNGRLYLDLMHPQAWPFILDLDLDVDLSELPAVLGRVIDNNDFLTELARFSNVSGKAGGHLRLQDRLDDIEVEVTVATIQAARADYDRLPWPIVVDSGQLRIIPGRVSWDQVTGNIGAQTISRAAGRVNRDDSLTFSLTADRADLDSGPLFTELLARDLIPAPLTKVVSGLDGPLQLTNVAVSGPLQTPDAWQYRLELEADALHWLSPLFTGRAGLDHATAGISNHDIRIRQARVTLFDAPLAVAGELSHNHLADWRGSLRFNGLVNEKTLRWLKELKLLPAGLPLKPRSTLQDLTVTWDKEKTALQGSIIAGTGAARSPAAFIDLIAGDESLDIRQLKLTGPTEQGILSLSRGRNQQLGLAWTGSVSATTINALLFTNIVSGHLSGTFQGVVSPDSESTMLDGWATVKGLNWRWQDPAIPLMAVDSLRIFGDGPRAVLEKMDLRLEGEPATLQGTIMPRSESLAVDLSLQAGRLSGRAISRLKDLLAPQPMARSTYPLTGRLAFMVDSLLWPSPFPADGETGAGPSYDIAPARGTVRFQPGRELSMDITSAGLCGLGISGTYHSDPDRPQEYTVTTPAGGTARFQDTLPCLGIRQDVIEGDFTMQARLLRRQGRWQGKSVAIHSENGTILRMRLLSQIFKVVNITDLFVTTGQYSGKGLAYSQLDLEADIDNNELVIDRAVIRGQGLNLFGRGRLDLATLDSDLTILIAPLKTLDAILARVPLVGRIIGGKNATVVTIPVGVKGNIKEPKITLLPPEAIGDAVIEMVRDTLLLPFRILSPILPKDKDKPAEQQETPAR
ncbi:MAG: AsmA-like C-terminal domain-containing protein [Desulfobacterales bacterium]|nr:AsmA-like C-terminal domain-containing protein [Desulfobacterales bacterium]